MKLTQAKLTETLRIGKYASNFVDAKSRFREYLISKGIKPVYTLT